MAGAGLGDPFPPSCHCPEPPGAPLAAASSLCPDSVSFDRRGPAGSCPLALHRLQHAGTLGPADGPAAADVSPGPDRWGRCPLPDVVAKPGHRTAVRACQCFAVSGKKRPPVSPYREHARGMPPGGHDLQSPADAPGTSRRRIRPAMRPGIWRQAVAPVHEGPKPGRPYLRTMWQAQYADGYYPLEDPAAPEEGGTL